MGRHCFPFSHLERAGQGALLALVSLLGLFGPSEAEASVRRASDLGGVRAGASTSRSARASLADHAGLRPSLSKQERATLAGGGLVTRPLTLDERGGHYVGGVSYAIVQVAPEDVLRHLMDVRSWAHFLPRVRSARLVDTVGGLARVELVQGNAVFSGKYTVGLVRSGAGDEFRFWLDRARPSDVRDVWGFFRVRPFGAGSSLVAVGALVDVGPGVVRWLFEDAVQRLVLETPKHIRAFVEPRALAHVD